ncbi:hypothetical protein PPYR_07264 [Photinus pyralis]|uniref:Thioredoxin domain-containing protein n=1 Tax=Photinus pyralis TaxID=7054 RepID=A0A1Y1JW39_PHOPY|nr:thioredoxin, mitochondrial [Photinus pyralis]KAB0799384.1 hypothetical protein PPYR_07264 [Photinus pyralis]
MMLTHLKSSLQGNRSLVTLFKTVTHDKANLRKICSSLKLNKIITIMNDDDFMSKVMNSDNPVIVNFHAEWCEPCHILTPKMKQLIEPKDNIDLAIVDVESHAELVHTFEVKAVPAVIAVKNGLVVDKFIGLVDANMIESLISKLDKKS